MDNTFINPDNMEQTYSNMSNDLLLYPMTSNQEQPGYFDQTWQHEGDEDSGLIDSLPVGLWASFFQSPEDGYDYTNEGPQSTDLSPDATTWTRSSNDPSKSPPAKTATSTPPSSAKSPKRRGRPAYPSQRKSHNEIEARYRGTINAALKTLQQVLPDSTDSNSTSNDERTRLNPTKAEVMISAASYINQLKEENRKLLEENNQLRNIIMSGQLSQSGGSTQA